MNKKIFVALGLVAISLMMIVPVFAAPKNAVGKNDNLYYLTYGEDVYLIMENGAGVKRAWCVDGPSAGDSFVYLDTTKLGDKAVAQLIASGDWKLSSGTFPGYIYKQVHTEMQMYARAFRIHQ